MPEMTQTERLVAYVKSLDTRHPHMIMVKLGQDGEPEWWANQGVVMGAENLFLCPACGRHGLASVVVPGICTECANANRADVA
jgi:hypothetical protein